MASPAKNARLAAEALGFTEVYQRGRGHLVMRNPVTGKFSLDTQAGGVGWHYGVDYANEVDSAWETSTNPAWQWQMVKAEHNLYARDVLNAGDTIQWIHTGSGESVTLQPLALNWVDDVTDSRQQITQPQAVSATPDGDDLYWQNGYGTGQHFRYISDTAKLIKHLIIDSAANLPAPTVSNPYLEIEFILKKSDGVTEWIDTGSGYVQWDRSTKTSTANAIQFRLSNGTAVWTFAKPGAGRQDTRRDPRYQPELVLGGGMTDLSILIPARNEMFLRQTIENILANIEADTEVIAVLDGQWADPPIPDHERVTLVYHPESIGQRAATNEAARMAAGKYVMKVDAHCAFDKGFDAKLIAICQHDMTVIPRMYNLHAFDWLCPACGYRTYQGPKPGACGCGSEMEMDIIWQPRQHTSTDFARFDRSLHFQYWREYRKRPEAQGEIADVMCCVGAAWMMERERYFDIGGMDENHGSWGQMGVELACKSWLSGGRQVVYKNTWFAHMFRTQPGFGFPYPNPGISKARDYSRWLWEGDHWDKAVRPFRWIIDKFAPVPEWEG